VLSSKALLKYIYPLNANHKNMGCIFVELFNLICNMLAAQNKDEKLR